MLAFSSRGRGERGCRDGRLHRMMRWSGRAAMAGVVAVAALGGACRRAGASGPAPERLAQDRALVDGHSTVVRHSPWDMGRTQDIFDADPATLARTRNANPAVVEIVFGQPHRIERVALTTASARIELRCTATLRGGETRTFSGQFLDLAPDSPARPGAARPGRARVRASHRDPGPRPRRRTHAHPHARALLSASTPPEASRTPSPARRRDGCGARPGAAGRAPRRADPRGGR